jgi:hypothetical protein
MSLPAPTCYYVGEPYGNLTFTKPEPLIPAITKPLWDEKAVSGALHAEQEHRQEMLRTQAIQASALRKAHAEAERLRQALINIRDATHTSAVVLRGLADNALTKD